ncbi:MAG: head GIN domain-containing protein [Saprospiraceae bacterium]
MRYLLIFMLGVGIFVLGKRSFHCSGFGGLRGEGSVRSENRTLGAFHAVEANFSGDVEVSMADQNAVTIETHENLLPHLKTEVKDGVLHIYFDTNVSYIKDLKVRISTTTLDALTLGGSGSIRTMTALKLEQLKLKISGSGDIDAAQLEITNLGTEITGSGTIKVGGKTNEFKAIVSGSGDIIADQLNSGSCSAAVTGSGEIDCGLVQQTLDAEVTGSGDIRYGGTPRTNVDITGSGSVKAK